MCKIMGFSKLLLFVANLFDKLEFNSAKGNI